MWLWLPIGFVIAFGFMWLYFNVLTPTLHHSWPLPLEGDRTEALWRLFWGCNFVGIWDELAFINLVFVLLARHFRFGEANLAQAVFFTSFLHEMAFVGWGPVVIFAFALILGAILIAAGLGSALSSRIADERLARGGLGGLPAGDRCGSGPRQVSWRGARLHGQPGRGLYVEHPRAPGA